MSFIEDYNAELYHYGVKGMKWGHRKARPISIGMGRSRSTNNASDAANREARKAKAKKAAKIGAAVVGTALAAYGTYKLASYMQDQRNQAAMAKAQDYVNNNLFRKMGESKFGDGNVQFDFANRAGDQVVLKGARNQVGKFVGQHNARTIATGKQIYKDATNTRLDRGLAKVVNAGDATKRAATSAGDAAKRAAASVGNTAKSAANKTKNRVLDVVNPIYEYTPGSTTTTTKNINGLNVTKSVTDIYKKKVRR